MQQDLSGSLYQQDRGVNGEGSMLRQVAGKVPNICVVGAGVAGLRCADVLLRHGANVTLIEGTKAPGMQSLLFQTAETRIIPPVQLLY